MTNLRKIDAAEHRKLVWLATTGFMHAPKPKCVDTDYINFLVASSKAFCYTEAAAVPPKSPDLPTHDVFSRLLHRLKPAPTLWQEALPPVYRKDGFLNLKDSTLDKHYVEKIELVVRHWSGKPIASGISHRLSPGAMAGLQQCLHPILPEHWWSTQYRPGFYRGVVVFGRFGG